MTVISLSSIFWATHNFLKMTFIVISRILPQISCFYTEFKIKLACKQSYKISDLIKREKRVLKFFGHNFVAV